MLLSLQMVEISLAKFNLRINTNPCNNSTSTEIELELDYGLEESHNASTLYSNLRVDDLEQAAR